MARPLVHLPRLVAANDDRTPVHGERHPMRAVTRATALDNQTWTRERAREVAAYFDAQASDWDERFSGDDSRLLPLDVAPDEVAGALPGSWSGVWSEAGDGSWAVLRRADPQVTLKVRSTRREAGSP